MPEYTPCAKCEFPYGRLFHICAPDPTKAPTKEVQAQVRAKQVRVAKAKRKRNEFKRAPYVPRSAMTPEQLEHIRKRDAAAHKRRRDAAPKPFHKCMIEGCTNGALRKGVRCKDCQAKRNTRAIRTRKSLV